MSTNSSERCPSTLKRLIRGSAVATAAWCFFVTGAPPATASEAWCTAEVGGSWDASGNACHASVVSNRQATMDISITVPDDVVNDPTMGPVIHRYVTAFANQWRTLGATMPRDNVVRTDYTLYSRSPSLKSVVFHEFWQTVGTLPNNAYRTWTFDLDKGRQVQLADLFRPGVDPSVALPPLVRPFLADALDQAPPPHIAQTYPFLTSEWEPQPDGSGFSSGYRAFAITADELILYLPDAPMAHPTPAPRNQPVWSMDGGTVTARIPLTALTSILRS